MPGRGASAILRVMTKGPAAPTARASSADKRKSLIDAAVQVITEEGVTAATTRRIADHAGLPPGLVHYWFADKDELMEAAIVTLNEDVVRHAAGFGDVGATAAERFRTLLGVATTTSPARQLAIYELTLVALRAPSLNDLAHAQHTRRQSAIMTHLEPFDATIEAAFPGGRPALSVLLAAVFDGIVLTWLATEDRQRLEGAVSTLELLLARAGI